MSFDATHCARAWRIAELNQPLLTDDASYTCTSTRYGQNYHSTHGALTESRHIYIDGADLPRRLSAARATRVLEIGFGLGLNCLLTADEALARGAHLSYVGVEHDLIDTAVFDALAYHHCLRHAGLVDALRDLIAQAASAGRAAPIATDVMTGIVPNLDREGIESPVPLVGQLSPGVTLTLDLQDATQSTLWSQHIFDVIYLDAFSEDVNPECWESGFLSRLRQTLAPDGVLVSYSVRGSVRRGLIQAGFQVEKRPGPPGKRHMLRAVPYPL